MRFRPSVNFTMLCQTPPKIRGVRNRRQEDLRLTGENLTPITMALRIQSKRRCFCRLILLFVIGFGGSIVYPETWAIRIL